MGTKLDILLLRVYFEELGYIYGANDTDKLTSCLKGGGTAIYYDENLTHVQLLDYK